MEKKCQYENCGNKITSGRVDKKYCSSNCRKYVAIYKKRERKRVQKKCELYLDLIQEFKTDFETSEDVKKLYELIYKR